MVITRMMVARDIARAILVWWFIGLPIIAFFTTLCLAVVAVAGLPLWLLIWWL